MQIGNCLKIALLKKNMTMEQLAKKSGIPSGTLYRYSANLGEPKQKRLILIAKALEMSPLDLINLEKKLRDL